MPKNLYVPHDACDADILHIGIAGGPKAASARRAVLLYGCGCLPVAAA